MIRMLRHLRAAFRRGRLDDRMREELEQHLAWKAEELQAAGHSPAEARRLAAVAVGNTARLREDSRALWGFPTVESVAQDVRYGLRQIRHAPAFSAVAILSLAVGIGASGAVFSLADALLFQKLPAVKDPDRLVVFQWRSGPVMPFSSLNGNSDESADGLWSTSFARVALDEMQRAGQGSIDVFGFADMYDVNVSIGGAAEIAGAHAVSGNYFDVLGVMPAAGRLLGRYPAAFYARPHPRGRRLSRLADGDALLRRRSRGLRRRQLLAAALAREARHGLTDADQLARRADLGLEADLGS